MVCDAVGLTLERIVPPSDSQLWLHETWPPVFAGGGEDRDLAEIPRHTRCLANRSSDCATAGLMRR
jgi:hypothetical protein